MLNLQFENPPPPQRRERTGAFTALIIALVIIVGSGAFLLATHCDGLTEEASDAPDVLDHAAEVEPEGQLTKELVFYNSEGELIIVPEEAASAGGDVGDPAGQDDGDVELPDEVRELLTQIEEINAESSENGTSDDNGSQPDNGVDEPPTGVTTYSVQVGAFGERANAEALKDKLGADGFPAFIISPAADAANPVYRVRVGPFAEPEAAKSTAAEIEKRYGLSTYIPQ
jgi:hypothetical protein